MHNHSYVHGFVLIRNWAVFKTHAQEDLVQHTTSSITSVCNAYDLAYKKIAENASKDDSFDFLHHQNVRNYGLRNYV